MVSTFVVPQDRIVESERLDGGLLNMRVGSFD